MLVPLGLLATVDQSKRHKFVLLWGTLPIDAILLILGRDCFLFYLFFFLVASYIGFAFAVLGPNRPSHDCSSRGTRSNSTTMLDILCDQGLDYVRNNSKILSNIVIESP